MAMKYEGQEVTAVNYKGQQVKEVRYKGQTIWSLRYGDAKYTIENLGGTKYRTTFEWVKEVNNDRQAMVIWGDDAGMYTYPEYLFPGKRQVYEGDLKNMFPNAGPATFFRVYWGGDKEAIPIEGGLVNDGVIPITSTHTYITE